MRLVHCHPFSLPVLSLAEQAKARERQEDKERRMIKDLEAAISDRDIFKKNQQVIGEEMEKIKAELALAQAKYVGFVLGYCSIFWVCCPDWYSQLLPCSNVLCVEHTLEHNA